MPAIVEITKRIVLPVDVARSTSSKKAKKRKRAPQRRVDGDHTTFDGVRKALEAKSIADAEIARLKAETLKAKAETARLKAEAARLKAEERTEKEAGKKRKKQQSSAPPATAKRGRSKPAAAVAAAHAVVKKPQRASTPLAPTTQPMAAKPVRK
jgi:hypothetical protein